MSRWQRAQVQLLFSSLAWCLCIFVLTCDVFVFYAAFTFFFQAPVFEMHLQICFAYNDNKFSELKLNNWQCQNLLRV